MSLDRRRRAQDVLQGASLDALVVTTPANIRYLTGLSASAGLALLLREARPRAGGTVCCVLLVDFRYATTARDLAAEAEDLEVQVVEGSLDTALGLLLRSLSLERVGIEADHLTVSRFSQLSTAVAAAEPAWLGVDEAAPVLVATQRLIERMRAVKDAGELAALREGGRRISGVARNLRALVQAGRTEREIAAAIDAAMRAAGFERPAFETIVASGPNAALPHARPTERRVGEAEGVLLDFGGVYDGYCVDLTRTVHLGTAPDAFRRLFDAVREAHAAAIAAVRAGALPVAVDAAARRTLERHGLGEAFGHGTGHGLGLEVHEEPRISPLAPEGEPLRAGMVITIEPGAYVPGTGGVRIEDDVLVTDDGCELLTDVPIEL